MINYILLGLIVVVLVAIFIVLLSINKTIYLLKCSLYKIEERSLHYINQLGFLINGQDSTRNLLKNWSLSKLDDDDLLDCIRKAINQYGED